MTDSGYTLIVLCVDRSGSMTTMRHEAESMVNDFIAEQAKQPGLCDVIVTEFDHHWNVALEKTGARGAPKYELHPRGGTALHDAMMHTAEHVGQVLRRIPDGNRPGRVYFVTVTDGHENSSQKFKASDVYDMVTEQTEKYRWEFVFLGANQNAILTARRFNIPQHSTMSYSEDAYAASGISLSNAVTRSRAGGQSVVYTDDERIAASGK